MSSPFIGEIRMAGFNFAPVNWAFCNGATMAISQNETLFTLIGTTYGGDGVNTFALPDLQGRVPVHQGTDTLGSAWVIGARAGTESVTLNSNQIPEHTHVANANLSFSTLSNPSTGVLAASSTMELYSRSPAPGTPLNAAAISSAGSGQPHDNVQPFTVINFIIALYGIFPSRS
jgi:microcystin-dependent protein